MQSPSLTNDQDAGLIRRGLILLAVMALIVGIVLSIIFHGPPRPTPAEEPARSPLDVALVLPAAGFPASIAWPALVQLAEEGPIARGWEIRYTSAATLARLGSDRTPWPLLREMLDEKRQMRNFREKLPDGKDVADEVAARTTVISALKAVADWHDKQRTQGRTGAPEVVKTGIYPLVDQLAQSAYPELKLQAEKTRTTFFR